MADGKDGKQQNQHGNLQKKWDLGTPLKEDGMNGKPQVQRGSLQRNRDPGMQLKEEGKDGGDDKRGGLKPGQWRGI